MARFSFRRSHDRADGRAQQKPVVADGAAAEPAVTPIAVLMAMRDRVLVLERELAEAQDQLNQPFPTRTPTPAAAAPDASATLPVRDPWVKDTAPAQASATDADHRPATEQSTSQPTADEQPAVGDPPPFGMAPPASRVAPPAPRVDPPHEARLQTVPAPDESRDGLEDAGVTAGTTDDTSDDTSTTMPETPAEPPARQLSLESELAGWTSSGATQLVSYGPPSAYDTARIGHPLAPGEHRYVRLAGVPANATAVVAWVTVSEPSGNGVLRISCEEHTGTSRIKARTGSERTRVLTLPVNHGMIALESPDAVQMQVHIDVLGWLTTAEDDRILPHAGDVIVKGRIEPGEGKLIPVSMRVGMSPEHVKAALMLVNVTGPKDGIVRIGPTGSPARAMHSIANVPNMPQSTWLVVPIGPDGSITMLSSTDVRVTGRLFGVIC